MINSVQNVNQKQRGAVLIVSLVILLLMTIIGISSMKSTTLEERMAGNMRDQNLAFQSAEAAIIEGENFLLNNQLIITDGSVNGLYNVNGNPAPSIVGSPAPNFTPPLVWADSNSIPTTTVTSLINEEQEARYLIEEIGPVSVPGEAGGKNITIDPSGNKSASGDVTGYKIIAIGRGPSGNSRAILVSYYGKETFQ